MQFHRIALRGQKPVRNENSVEIDEENVQIGIIVDLLESEFLDFDHDGHFAVFGHAFNSVESWSIHSIQQGVETVPQLIDLRTKKDCLGFHRELTSL